MTLYISGGSNSLLRNGWVRGAGDFAPGDEVVNLSIGATCSITGLFRSLFTADLQAGDTLVWEYALNDANHIANFGLSSDFILKYLEVLLAHCATRQVTFAALIFVPQEMESEVSETPYKIALKQLFDHWGVAYADISFEYRRALGVETLPADLFEVPTHYRTTDPIIDFIIARTASLIADASVPAATRRLRSDPGMGVVFLDQWSGGKTDDIGTQLVRLPARQPDPDLRLTPPCDCRVICVVEFAASFGGAFAFESGGQAHVVSASFWGADEKRRLSPAFIPDTQEPPFDLVAGQDLVVRWAAQPSPAISGTRIKRRLNRQDIAGREGWLVGLLAEAPGGLGSG